MVCEATVPTTCTHSGRGRQSVRRAASHHSLCQLLNDIILDLKRRSSPACMRLVFLKQDCKCLQAWRWDADRAVSSAKAIPMSPGRIRPNRVSSIGLPVHNSNPTPNEGATSSQPLRGQKVRRKPCPPTLPRARLDSLKSHEIDVYMCSNVPASDCIVIYINHVRHL